MQHIIPGGEKIRNRPDIPAVILFDWCSKKLKRKRQKTKTTPPQNKTELCGWVGGWVGVGVLHGEGSMRLSVRAAVAVRTALYLTIYSDCLTCLGFDWVMFMHYCCCSYGTSLIFYMYMPLGTKYNVTHMHICLCACTHAHTHTHAHTCTHTHAHTYVRVRTHTHTHSHTHMHMHARACAHTHTDFALTHFSLICINNHAACAHCHGCFVFLWRCVCVCVRACEYVFYMIFLLTDHFYI